jgi:hypothetical protein
LDVSQYNFDALVSIKSWDDSTVSSTYYVEDFPVPIYASDAGNDGWYTVAVTSNDPLSYNDRITIKATCSPILPYYSKTEIWPQQLYTYYNEAIDYGYYFWSGNGSVISASSNGSSYGNVKDIAVLNPNKPSMVSFQWQSSYGCRRLKVYSPSGSFSGYLEWKNWDESNYIVSDYRTFPQYFNASDEELGDYSIISVKTDATHISSIVAECE